MLREEVEFLMGCMQIDYPRFYQNLEYGTPLYEATVSSWAEMLEDVPFEIGKLAYKKLVATCKYLPTKAELRQAVADIAYIPPLDPGEAWANVNRAISHYGYANPAGAKAMLSDVEWQAVQQMGGWRTLCHSDISSEMGNRAHFLKIFENLNRRQYDDRQVPERLRLEIVKVIKVMPPSSESFLGTRDPADMEDERSAALVGCYDG